MIMLMVLTSRSTWWYNRLYKEINKAKDVQFKQWEGLEKRDAAIPDGVMKALLSLSQMDMMQAVENQSNKYNNAQ